MQLVRFYLGGPLLFIFNVLLLGLELGCNILDLALLFSFPLFGFLEQLLQVGEFFSLALDFLLEVCADTANIVEAEGALNHDVTD